jgi:hypothetical protein
MTALTRSPAPLDAPLDIKFVGSLDGRFILPDRGAITGVNPVYPCRSQSITASELIIASPIPVEIGERFASTFNRLGPISGEVTRVVYDGFAVGISASEVERKSLAATIHWLKRRHVHKAEDNRAAPRIKTRPERCTMRYLDADFAADLFDVSISGASLAGAAPPPPLNSVVRIGRVEAQVVRHMGARFGVKFLATQSLTTVLGELTAGG